MEGNGSVVQLRAIPLVVTGCAPGALVLVRDVTELRHRERELMTKDATIREIHHRVKNNLQTVAALLRLQSRRLEEPKARAALDEAVRRVGSIATVHETLSHAPEEIVDFDDVAARVAAMAGEVSAAEARVKPVLLGRFGPLPSAVATPLALVLAELLQNALQHGLARRERPDAGLDGLLEVSVRAQPGAADGHRAGQWRRIAGGIRPGFRHEPRPADRPDPGRVRTGRPAARSSPGRAAAPRPWLTCRWTRGPRYRPGRPRYGREAQAEPGSQAPQRPASAAGFTRGRAPGTCWPAA